MLIFLILLFFFFILFKWRIFLKPLFWKRDNKRRIIKAAKKTPIYQNRNLNNFLEIPPMTKRELMSNIEKSVSNLSRFEIYSHLQTKDRYLEKGGNRYVIATSSGTSGQMGVFIHDWNSWVETQSILFKNLFLNSLISFLPYIFTGIRAVFVVVDGHFMTRKIAIPVFQIFFIETIILSIFEENLTEKIEKYNPHILHVYPSFLNKIMNCKISPLIITTGSEHLTTCLKQKIKQKFPNTKLIETYGCSECVFLGSSCDFGNIHLDEDNCIVEAIDEDGEIILGKGIPSSKIYITNCINTFQPLIRYEISDSIEYIDCSCGSKNTAIKIIGRIDDCFYLIDDFGNYQKHDPISLETIFVSIPESFDFQLIHISQNFLQININKDVRNEISNNLNNYLKRFNLTNVKYFFDDKFLYERSGKKRQILNNFTN